MNEQAVSINNLNKIYDKKIILKNFSLKINWGQVSTIFGPNGSGKSTLIRILGNITDYDQGDIYIQNRDFKVNNNNIRKTIGVVTHQTFLYDHLSVEENLKYYCQVFGISNYFENVLSAIEKFNLNKYRDTHVRKLSRGTQQRVALARATLHHPRILLLDEPDSGLDNDSLKILIDIIDQHKSSGGLALIATHNLEFGISVSDSLLILSDGQIAFSTNSNSTNKELFNYEYQKITKEKL